MAHTNERTVRDAPESHATELPILGEPLPIELANTWYEDEGEVIDFLGPRLVGIWLKAAGLTPTALSRVRQTELRAVRDATRDILLSAIEAEHRPSRSSLATLNSIAALVPQRVRLVLDDGVPVRELVYRGPAADRLAARLAHVVIDFVASSSWEAIRRCDAPDCPMFFVQQHRRRRFCHPTCSQRGRQAAYYRRKRDERS